VGFRTVARRGMTAGEEASWLAAADAIALLRAGASPAEAWRGSYGVGVEADGAPAVADALPEADALRAAGRLARQTGAPLASVLETVVECEKARSRARIARDVALAGPQASAVVLRWLPAVGWALAGAVDLRAPTILVTTGLGWVLLATGVGLWLVGTRWMARLTRRAEAAGAGESAAVPLALVEASIAAGLDIPSALDAAGESVAGTDHASAGRAMSAAARSLRAGVDWERSWARADGSALVVARALRASWTSGSAPIPRLRAAREAAIDRGRADAERAAAELGVRVSLPLALCLLPSFVVVGIVPLLLAVAKGSGLELSP